MTAEEDPTIPRRTPWRTFVRLLEFLRPYRSSLVASSALAIASQIALILVPVLAGVVVNQLKDDPDTGVIALEIAAVVGLGLLDRKSVV